jgi:hypothetical protein
MRSTTGLGVTALAMTILLLVASTPVRAQGVRFGLAGGINLSEINASGDEFLNVAFGDKLEPTGGIFFVVPFADSLWLQPEALYSIKGTEGELNGREGRIRLTYIEVPVLLRYAGPEDSTAKIHVFTGPYAAYLIRATSRIRFRQITETVNVEDAFERLDYGWTAGVGVGVGGAQIDFRYSWGLPNIAEEQDLGGLVPDPVPGNEITFRNRGFTVLVAYRF